MPKAKNAVWRFFASVKLALFSLIVLAAVSIIGTVIKQGQDPSYYGQEYGATLSRLFEALGITNMYSSWWFVFLLFLFAVNLVVCSIERLPRVWHLVTQDNLNLDPHQLKKRNLTHQIHADLPTATAAERIHQVMTRIGWRKILRLDRKETALLFSQKGSWSRLGVYVVHLSILVILVGAITGTFFGFKAFVYLPEGRSTDKIFLQRNQAPVPLPFELYCDRYDTTFYPNGMVKEYRLDLTVFDPEEQAPYRKTVIVNDPLSYRGLTFYQAESYPLEEYFIVIRNNTTGMEQAFRVPSNRDVSWPGTRVTFRIEELKNDQDGAVRQAKIHFTSGEDSPPSFWIKDRETVSLQAQGDQFTLSFRQLYTTLLLVKKDPGVLIVYAGCILMLTGLAMVFFLSHRRIWILLESGTQKQGSMILISGVSNKNKSAFEQRFEDLAEKLEKELPNPTGKE